MYSFANVSITFSGSFLGLLDSADEVRVPGYGITEGWGQPFQGELLNYKTGVLRIYTV